MRKLAITSALTLAVVVACHGQGKNPYGITGKMMLLQLPEVKKEIKLTKDEDKQIQELMKQVQADPMSMAGSIDLHYMTKGIDAKAVQILQDDQKSRLEEIWYQANGLFALSEDEAAVPLGLSQEVRTKIGEISTDHDKKSMDLMMNARSNMHGLQKALDANDKQAIDAITALLTPQQIEKWKTMQGKPCKLPKNGR